MSGFPARFPDRLLTLLLGWTVFTAILPTLIVYRAGLQPEYEWGIFGLVGEGASSGYLLVVVAAILAWATVTLGYRGAHRPFGILLLGWHGFVFAMLLYGVFKFGNQMEIRGDALGLRINIALVGPALGAAVLLASVRWLWRDGQARRRRTAQPWRRGANVMLIACAPIGMTIVVLFSASAGGVHQNTDRMAVILVIVQGLLYANALKPVRTRPAIVREESVPVHR